MLPTTMTAVPITRAGGPEVLQPETRPVPHLGSQVTPIIDSVLPLSQAAQGHARMKTSEHIGKILLEVAG